jgi:hypothetical protein
LGTSKNDKVTSENKEPAEARECTLFSPEMHELTVCGRVVMMKLEESNHLQFPFALASPSFPDGPGLQDNVFGSL